MASDHLGAWNTSAAIPVYSGSEWPPANHPVYRRYGIMRGVLNTNDLTRRTYALDPRFNQSCPKVVGHNGHTFGDWWPMQICTLRDGVHGARISGISGDSNSGAYSVVLSGTYQKLALTVVLHSTIAAATLSKTRTPTLRSGASTQSLYALPANPTSPYVCWGAWGVTTLGARCIGSDMTVSIPLRVRRSNVTRMGAHMFAFDRRESATSLRSVWVGLLGGNCAVWADFTHLLSENRGGF